MIRDKRGVTLIELLIVVGIIGVVIATIGTFLNTNVRIFNTTERSTEAQADAQLAMDYFTATCIKASGIHTPSATNPLFQSGNFVSIELIDQDGTFVTLSYDRVAKTLSRTRGVTSTVLAKNITNVSIENTDPLTPNAYTSSKGLKITISSDVQGQTITLNNEVYFRNNN